jgi:hypothetical protein
MKEQIYFSKEKEGKKGKRMRYKWNNLLNEYFSEKEGLVCPTHYVENGCRELN